MLRKISSTVTSLTSSPAPTLPSSHHGPSRARTYVDLATRLSQAGVPVDPSDCLTCELPCPPDLTGPEAIWGGKSYENYVSETYGDLGSLPEGFDTDWESELAGSAQGGRGRVVVISTGKSDWQRDHTDEENGFAHQLHEYIRSLPSTSDEKGGKFDPAPKPVSYFISPAALPSPSTISQSSTNIKEPPSLYSSSLISQSHHHEDQTVLIVPDWKVVHEVENSRRAAKTLFQEMLDGQLGRAGRLLNEQQREEGMGRTTSWVLPYRAVILLCSHKRRDKRCHIAAPLLRSALHTCLSTHSVHIDETGSSLSHISGAPLEDLTGTETEREAEIAQRISSIESVHGGDGGEVGIFNINHLGGHRYAGVMLIFFPSGAYVSYGRITPQEIPRIVEETILKGRIVPGLLRNAVGVSREGAKKGCGFLGW